MQILHFEIMDPEEDIQRFITAFGQRVKALREERNMTQLDLAVRSGMDVRQIQRIEYGEINTSIGNAFLIANAFEISLREFVGNLKR